MCTQLSFQVELGKIDYFKVGIVPQVLLNEIMYYDYEIMTIFKLDSQTCLSFMG